MWKGSPGTETPSKWIIWPSGKRFSFLSSRSALFARFWFIFESTPKLTLNWFFKGRSKGPVPVCFVACLVLQDAPEITLSTVSVRPLADVAQTARWKRTQKRKRVNRLAEPETTPREKALWFPLNYERLHFRPLLFHRSSPRGAKVERGKWHLIFCP